MLIQHQSIKRVKSVKRATNLSLSSDVLDTAKALNINLSKVCDAYLREYLRQVQAERWREEHAAFISAYNETLASEGLPLESWRAF